MTSFSCACLRGMSILLCCFLTCTVLYGQQDIVLTPGTDYHISSSYIRTGTGASVPAALTDVSDPYLHIRLTSPRRRISVEVDLSYCSAPAVAGRHIFVLASSAATALPLVSAYASGAAVLYRQGAVQQRIVIPLGDMETGEIGILADAPNLISQADIRLLLHEEDPQADDPGPGPHSGYEINCSDKIDDDRDGLVDCYDPDCTPSLDYYSTVSPSCPICNDGSITVGHNMPSFRPALYISIDGGLTWSHTTLGYLTFDHLAAGTYGVVLSYFPPLTNNTCRSAMTEVVVTAPPPGYSGPCANGGFEEGTFSGWTGGLGTYKLDFNTGQTHLTITNDNFALNDRHTIVAANPNLKDPYAGDLFPFITPEGGSYFAKIGKVEEPGPVEGRATRLKYRFTVDEHNKDFRFYWAAVSEAFHQGPNRLENPKIIWNYKDLTTNTEIPGGDILMDPAQDNFFTKLEDDLVFRGWTCEEKDLSDFLGHLMEFEFIVTNCSPSAHWAYAYLDALCLDNRPIDITCSLHNENLCKGQQPIVTVTGTGFNQYRWTVSKINGSGQPYDVRDLGWHIGYVVDTDDLLAQYLATGVADECVVYRFTVDVHNDCGRQGQCSFDLRFSCSEYDIDYCEIMKVFDVHSNPTIHAGFDCPGCTYSWSPAQYFGSTADQKEPTIRLSTWADGANRDYYVVVTTPEGCVYYDTVMVRPQTVTLEKNVEVGYCSSAITFTLDFGFPIDASVIDLIIRDRKYGIFYEDAVLISESSDGHRKTYTVHIDRSVHDAQRVELIVRFVNASGDEICFDLDQGTIERKFDLFDITASTYDWLRPWAVYIPNVFEPLSSDPSHNTFWPQFMYFDDQVTCDSFMLGSSVYYAHISIFDRWGAEVWDSEISVDPASGQGIDGRLMAWDGYYLGQLVNPGTYAFYLEIRSCASAVTCAESWNCDPVNERRWCSDGVNEYRLIEGGITVIF